MIQYSYTNCYGFDSDVSIIVYLYHECNNFVCQNPITVAIACSL